MKPQTSLGRSLLSEVSISEIDKPLAESPVSSAHMPVCNAQR